MSNGNGSPRLLTSKQAAAMIGFGASTLEKLRVFGGGPKYIKLSNAPRGRVLYDVSDIEAWLEARKRANTSQRNGEAA